MEEQESEMDKYGKETGEKGSLFASLSTTVLPKKKVKVGDTWGAEKDLEIPNLSLPAKVKVKNKLQKVEQKDDKKIATIKTIISVDTEEVDTEELPTPTDTDFSLKIKAEATNLFNITDGWIENSKMDLIMELSVESEEPNTGTEFGVSLKAKLKLDAELKPKRKKKSVKTQPEKKKEKKEED
jgi:hypothetical protein